MAIVPTVYMFTQYSPMVVAHLWEFCIAFAGFYLSNRVAMWYVHRGCEGGDQELWRGSQMWVWMAPNHIKAILKVMLAEVPLLRLLKFEVGWRAAAVFAIAALVLSGSSTGLGLCCAAKMVCNPFAILIWLQISFVVTSKEAQSSNLMEALSVTWPHLLYCVAWAAGTIYVIVTASLGYYSAWEIVLFMSAVAWGALIILCVWPPLATLLPRYVC